MYNNVLNLMIAVFAVGVPNDAAVGQSTQINMTSDQQTAAAPSDCPAGSICFWNGVKYTGNKCEWNDFDDDWTSGEAVCRWATTKNVKSVYNNTRFTFEYFKEPHYRNRVGSTQPYTGGNLAGTYKLGSHRRVCNFLGCQK